MRSFAVSRALSTAVVTLHGEVDQPSIDGLTFVLRTAERSIRDIILV